MGKYRDKENPLIAYTSGDLFSFQLAVRDYISKNPYFLKVNLDNEPTQVIKDIFARVGYDAVDISVIEWAKVAVAIGIPNPENKESFQMEVEFLDVVDVLELESFLAFLRRTGFNIGDYDGEEWDTPGYDSYE